MSSLDKRDRDIIKQLDLNARISISAIAKKLRTSKEVVNYRLKKLIEREVITSFVAVIDSFTLGYQIYRIKLRLKKISKEKKQDLLNWVKKNEYAAGISKLAGKLDFMFLFWSKNPAEFNKVYDEFMKRYGSFIQNKTVSIKIECEIRPYNFLYDNFMDKSLNIGKNDNLTIDEKDYLILDLLSKNCRLSLVEIAQKIKLTANAVKYRIKQLENKQIIKGYRIILNNDFFDLIYYKILFYLTDPSKTQLVKNFLTQQKIVVYITKGIGTNDIEADVLVKNAKEIYAMERELNEKCSDIVADFDELIVLEVPLTDYFPNK